MENFNPMKTKLILSILLLTGVCSSPRLLADSAEEMNKLRETLRNSLLQVRDLQNKVATLEAQDADKALTITDLETKLEATQKKLADDKVTADRTIALLEEKNQQFEEEIGRLQVALEKWKASHKESTALAQKTEVLRSKLASEKIRLERIVTDQRTKNHEMFKVAMEVLDRYKRHALGDAIAAREPFTGNMRAKLQQLSQEYGDRIADQRIKPESLSKPSASAPTTQAAN